MKYKLIKDKKIRKKLFFLEVNKLINKFMYVNLLNNSNIKDGLKKKISKYLIINSKKISKTKVVRRCVFTGRSRVSNRILGISRIKLRDLLKNDLIPGFSKAIW